MSHKSKRIEELKIAFKNGTLMPEPRKIAERLLSNARARLALALIKR